MSGTLINYSEYLRCLSADTFTIFLFHGVVRGAPHPIRNYTRKHLPIDEFISIIRLLRATGTPVSMPQVVEATKKRQPLPKHSFVITFDDGFENNYSVAAPVLADFNVPATFYITTDFVESNSSSWTDRIESAVETASEIHLDCGIAHLDGAYRTREEKIGLLDKIRSLVKGDSSRDAYAFADQICERLGAATFEPDPELDQKMAWAQINELDADPLFTVGGHGHTHRILDFLDDTDLDNELSTSVNILRSRLGHAVDHYSYPEGLPNCYSQRVIDLLRRHGVICAPTAEPGNNRVGDDLFRLKRVMVS